MKQKFKVITKPYRGSPVIHFWYHYDRVYYVLQNLCPLQHDDIQRWMKSLVETQYKILNNQPSPEI